MKRLLVIILLVSILTGCSQESTELDRAMSLREKLLNGNGCSFDAVITADYGDVIYTFEMNCSVDSLGALTFNVTKPDTIAGITGKVSEQGGKLTFDDQALAFSMLADGQVTPVSAPWLMVHTLRSGYLTACAKIENGLQILIDDSYEEEALQLTVWTDANEVPSAAQILWQGRRILSLQVQNFIFL